MKALEVNWESGGRDQNGQAVRPQLTPQSTRLERLLSALWDRDGQ